MTVAVKEKVLKTQKKNIKQELKKEDYKFGIIKNMHKYRDYRDNGVYGVCNCGQSIMNTKGHYNRNFECNKCGNTFFVDAKNQSNERFVIPYLESKRKDNRGFFVRRVNLSVVFKDGVLTPVKENLVRVMEYDIIDRVLRVWRNGVLEYDFEKGNNNNNISFANQRFFTQLDESLFLDFVSNEVTRGMFEASKQLSTGGWNQKNNTLHGLVGLFDHLYLQILANAGIPEVGRFLNRRYNQDIIDAKKTKPHEILKVPKFVMQYIREDTTIERHILMQLQGQLQKIDSNKMRSILSIVKDESNMKAFANCLDTLMQIHVDYNYTNIKKLALYIFREVRLTQGITSPQTVSNLLRDYIRMSIQMDLDYEKYPKSLKKEHDIVQMNYKVKEDKYKQQAFVKSVKKKSYQQLNYAKKDYSIITPESSNDIVIEGNELSHCISSYVNDVINDKCKIMFLRNTDDLYEPLVSVEVRGLNIRQARGKTNRVVKDEEKEFIKEWAEEKGLVEAYY